jgi:aerobic-type carbon monoxide dehydrogenase small subunit (CoxS/CutS family)
VIAVNTTLRVNDTTHELSVDSRLTLLDALRDVLGLTGTKKGCGQILSAVCAAYPNTSPPSGRCCPTTCPP